MSYNISEIDVNSFKSKSNPCGICKKGVERNSIECSGCKKWIHKKCSGIKGTLKGIPAASYAWVKPR